MRFLTTRLTRAARMPGTVAERLAIVGETALVMADARALRESEAYIRPA